MRCKPRMFLCGVLCSVRLLVTAAAADQTATDQHQAELRAALAAPILEPATTQAEVAALIKARLAPLPEPASVTEWEPYARRLRQHVLDEVVFRGEIARRWRDAPLHVEWLETLDGGPGYRLKKLRYEAVPGLWIPALLYEPLQLNGKVPVFLNVNGHDGQGKAAVYKQIRCINQAKRGILALNVEWLGMGQLRGPGYAHGRMNQLDLCGQSGLAVFFLAMQRGLDVLLSLDHADPARVGMAGLSGGGWQTIWLSALDERVTLANPVAGYSSFLTRVEHHQDLGDSEQTPTDFGKYADYLHLTALRAPRPTLLTYNAQDDCCFAAGYALPPLLAAVEPLYRLYGRSEALATHINHDPGTHNFELDNRQALYRMISRHFFPDADNHPTDELPTTGEIRTAEELHVPLPTVNESFSSLALALARDLPRQADWPRTRSAADEWQTTSRRRLRDLLRWNRWPLEIDRGQDTRLGEILITRRKLQLGDEWTIPVIELSPPQPQQTTVVVDEQGRAAATDRVAELLAQGHRVVVADLFAWGECAFASRAYLWNLLVATVGERPLGIQAGQLSAVLEFARVTARGPVFLIATGPRAAVVALAAAALAPKETLARITLQQPLPSLKVVLEENRSFEQSPELFCFGLLEYFDMPQLAALNAPVPLHVPSASERIRQEWQALAAWWSLWNAPPPVFD